MKKKDLLEYLEKNNFRPGKILGQNFLIDDNLLDFIIKATNPQENENILEVGPGFGALTRKLLASKANLTAIEFDHRICEYLRDNVKDDNFTLVEGDAVRVNVAEIYDKNTPFRAIANLPYSISSIFVARMLELENPPADMYFMLQKEMGLRLSAEYNTKDYGALSIRTQCYYDVKILRIVPPQVFHPAPEVESAIVAFYKKENALGYEERQLISKITKMVFSQRRKKMIKPLSSLYPKEDILATFKKLDIREDIRPGALTVTQFIDLARELEKLRLVKS
ncbi:16S rRNA (adenine(1518)-N(6)/adenine(1519)-N(6))-dimethyltransferase RsmA [Lentisphaerota bacterium WC36G]|nr:16S rRNA (adenine(1518)-N(6)/adenine(1519)-N(6))-dimethyltransferase RsmA [Lentisphaerae bacterium WC36]